MTTNDLQHIWQPLRVGPVELKHRIMVSGHTQLYGKDGTLSDRHIAYYRARAAGGAALLVLEQQGVHPAVMNYHAGCGSWERRVIPWYERLGDAVHPHGCAQFVQLFASGAQGRSTQYIDHFSPLWSASGIPSAISNEKPLAMEQQHIDELVEHFALSAENVKLAGLDGIEVHAAHSQLVGEFLSPAFNKRSDRYGGSVRDRCQLAIEIGDAIRKRVGPDFCLGIRLSADEYLGGAGITLEQTEEQLDVLAATGFYDFFDISGGGYHTLHIAVAPMDRMPEGFLAPAAERAKRVVGERGKVFVVGRVLDLRTAEEIVAKGAADMVAMTRAHMADPAIVRKTREGREREITRCVGANVCVKRLIDNVAITCVMNPSMGREDTRGTLEPATTPRDILVVGGGPAGMRAAATAAARGHRVRLWEKEDALGGHLRTWARLPDRRGWSVAIDNLQRPVEDRGVEISLGREIDAASVTNAGADVVVLAVGSHWDAQGLSAYRPDRNGIPGHDRDHVLDLGTAASRALENAAALGRRVLMVDESESYTPLALAQLLAEAGVEVEIVSPRAVVGGDTLKILEMLHVFPKLKAAGVHWRAQHFVEEIREKDVLLYNTFGGEPFAEDGFDTVVLSLFRQPERDLFDALKGAGPELHRVGDCLTPRSLEAVIHEADELGRAL